MTVIQSGKVEAFIAHPSQDVNAVLIYGPDTGLVSERAAKLAAAYVGSNADPVSITRLTSSDLSEDPGRLADEATSMSLFGGQRVLRVRPESQQIAPILEPLLARIDKELLLIVEAGQMAPNVKLRKLFETKPGCAAIPCYQDTQRDLVRILNDQLREAGFSINDDARDAFVARLGGDRLASRNEVEKLCLYCHGSNRINLADIEAIAGDVSSLALDDLNDAVGLGDLLRVDQILVRLSSDGTSPDQIIASAIRHFLLVHELRAEVEAGGRTSDIVDKRRPPIFFKRKQAIAAQIQLWPVKVLNRALEILGEGERSVRSGGALAAANVSQTLLTICHQAGRLKQRR